MSADMHVVEVDQQDYLDDALSFLADHGEPPGRDVTVLRDAEDVPAYVKRLMHREALSPDESMLLADSLELARRDRDFNPALDQHILGTVHWLRHWADGHGCTIGGIH